MFHGQPDWQGWTTHDPTWDETIPHWHASQTNSANLDPTPGNWGVISHHEGDDYSGYGNAWDDRLEFRLDMKAFDPSFDPETDTTAVHLRFHYNQYLEAHYDFFLVEYLAQGSWQTLFSQDGGDGSAQIFDSDDHGGIVFLPSQYDSTGSIVLRLRVLTDGAWSDEDGLFSTGGLGAAAIDSILVEINGAVASVADWEPTEGDPDELPEGSIEGHDNGAALGTDGWIPIHGPFAGDFSKLFSDVAHHDPCIDNASVVAGFIDDGTPPNNAPGVSTGGSQCPSSGYAWVVNYTDGISGPDEIPVHNEIWSPPIAWDLPGADDDGGIGMVRLEYDAYYDFPSQDGFYALWRTRAYTAAEGWGDWRQQLFYFGAKDGGFWKHESIDITGYLPSLAEVESIQVALGVIDAADYFQVPGDCATIAPLYDNVSLMKIRPGGPYVSVRTVDAFQGGFPADGTLTGPVRLDMARDINGNFGAIVPGDSMVVSIESAIPGRSLADSLTGGVLHVAQLTNPYFASQRAAALAQLGATLWGHDPQSTWPIYTYEVDGSPATSASGTHVVPLYAFDLPDGPADINAPHQSDESALFFGGDVLHWYVEAADDGGGVTTLPGEIDDFFDFGRQTSWPQAFSLHALPKLDEQGKQIASTLVWNDNFQLGQDEIYRQTFQEICWDEGVDYDCYRTRGPLSGVSNGLGAAHHRGATPEQLSGYTRLVYLGGTLSTRTISDGSASGGNDKADDLGLIQAWFAQDGDRAQLLFGDNLAGSLCRQGSATRSYMNDELGVSWIDPDVSDRIDGQWIPKVGPTGIPGPGWFDESFVADGSCPTINSFDEIAVFTGSGAQISHEFADPSGTPYVPSVVAGTWWDRQVLGNRRLSTFHPFDLAFVSAAAGSGSTGLETRARVLTEMLEAMGASAFCPGDPVAVGDPIAWRFTLAQNHPNPFNPRTVIRLSAPQAGDLLLQIYDSRGRRVVTLHDGSIDAGPHEFIWNGRDGMGRPVASGIYFYRAEGFGRVEVRKMALLR